MYGRHLKVFLMSLFVIQAAFALAQNTSDSVIIVKVERAIKLVIDPGHGGSDPGNLASNADYKHEKDLNLAIALKLGKYIEERVQGVEVLYTRTSDKRVTLDEIVDFANNAKADFFVSIHCNSSPVKAVTGTQCHIQNHRFATSKALAAEIDKQFSARAGRKSLGVIARSDRGFNLQVLQYTEMPGVLIETGFMTHPLEEKFLNSDYGQDLIASAIFRAFRDFATAPKMPAADNRSVYYKVQIAASKEKVNTQTAAFRKLDMRVDEVPDPKSSYKFRYMVGREYDRKYARELARKVRQLGFKDAFVVKMPF